MGATASDLGERSSTFGDFMQQPITPRPTEETQRNDAMLKINEIAFW